MVNRIRGLDQIVGEPILAYQWAEVPGTTLSRSVAMTSKYLAVDGKPRGLIAAAATASGLHLISLAQGGLGMKAVDRYAYIPRESLSLVELQPGKGMYQLLHVATNDGFVVELNVQKMRIKAMRQVVEALGFKV